MSPVPSASVGWPWLILPRPWPVADARASGVRQGRMNEGFRAVRPAHGAAGDAARNNNGKARHGRVFARLKAAAPRADTPGRWEADAKPHNWWDLPFLSQNRIAKIPPFGGGEGRMEYQWRGGKRSCYEFRQIRNNRREEGYGPRRLNGWSTLRLDVAPSWWGEGPESTPGVGQHACRQHQAHQVRPPGNAQLASGMLGEYQRVPE